jgi:mycoketide-CoA synthase
MLEQAPELFYPDLPTLVDALRWWSSKSPDQPAVTFLADGESETARLTYAELDREAQRVAASLQQFMDPGDRALLCFPPGLDFVIAYLGSVYARVIAVPVYVPRKNRHLDRLAAIAADSGAVVALTNAKAAPSLQGDETRQLLNLPVFTIDDSGSNENASWRPPEIAAEDIAFLQYTSGSTGTPRGVMVTHQNLATNIRMMGHALGSHAGTRIVSWLPAFHDMGLIGTVLMPIWQGLSTVLMPPTAFIQEPARWLRAISKYRATLAIGPNFGYELCCRHADADGISGLDLSSWEVACNGAEPIRAETLEKFCSIFGPAGFRRSAFFPCYGLAEATVYASGRHLGSDRGIWVDRASLELGRITLAGSDSGSQELVSCGYSPIGQSVAIVDPDTMRESASGEVGEIWLAGDHVAQGYWQNADATAATFGATTPARGEAKFLRTGDLGFLHEGQIFVTGRLKDLIIIYGRNFYPQDIESTVDVHPAIRGSVSFSLSGDALEGVGIVAEVALNRLRGDLALIAEEITAAIWEEHEVSVAQIAFLKPAGLPRTSSGKLRRGRARDLLLGDGLAEVFRWPAPPSPDEDAESVEDQIPGALPLRRRLLSLPVPDRHGALMDLVTKEIGTLLRRSPDRLDPGGTLSELVLDSVMALELRSRLAAATGLRLRSTLLFDYPTAGAVARHMRVLLDLGDEDGAVTPSPIAASGNDPIAVVAMSCRLPGGVATPEELWQLLLDERDAISAFPRNRGWTADGDADGRSPAGGVLADADQFDPAFFGISPREAIAIDPQQRLLLETSWEALERAGICPAALQGSPGGVFVGIFGNDYGARVRNAGAGPADLKGYLGTGSLTSVASGRIAYALGLEGPAISVDTACSSSLVAVHLACQALRQGECTLALAGGATVMATPAVFSELGPESAGARDGRSKAFAAEADGAGWSEGVGVVLLERLSDAQRNDHPVLAIVRGSAVNQDGRSQGLTAPNGPSQERVIRQALANARLSTADIDVVEAHGTGTALGDPIEAQALLSTYGAGRAADRPVWLGSLKSNLGHTQAAAGVGGLIKMVLALQHRTLPRTLHAHNASPLIDWSAGTVRLLNEAIPWAGNGHPRRAAVSSFGLSGTNAHLILEEAPAELAYHPPSSAEPRATALPVLLSGRSDRALRGQAENLHAYLVEHPEVKLSDLAYSLATTRSLFEHRAVLVAHGLPELRDELKAVASEQPAPNTAFGQDGVCGKVAFVFPGQGSEWIGMALSLLESSQVFRDRLEECDRAFAPYLDWSLLEVLREQEGAPALDGVDVVQPVLFAVMVALAAVWRSIGVEPDAVVGHSQGEIAAAYVAGALSLKDAAKLVALRSRALRRLAGKGAMAVVGLQEGELQKQLARFGRRLSIAALNGPASSVVSGAADDIDTLVRELSDAQVFSRKLPIEIASHCAQIDAIEDELRLGMAGLEPREAAVPFYSALTGARVDGASLDADYWYRNIRQPVRFAPACESLLSDGHRFFVEVSPHPMLVTPLLETIEAAEIPAAVVGSLRRGVGDLACVMQSLGGLHTRGLGVDWSVFFRALHPHRIDLPTYAFQRDRFWLEAPRQQRADVASAGLMAADHPLLGAAVELADTGGLVLAGRISLAQHPWLADHAVYGRVILPGSAFVELALAAGQRTGLDRVEELTLEAALPLPAEGAVAVQLTVDPPDDTGRRLMTLHSRAADGTADTPWIRHASGILGAAVVPARFDLRTWPPADAVEISLDGFYERLAGAGLTYDHAFRGLRAVWRRADETFAEVQLPEAAAADADRFGLHPALLDAVLHAAALDIARGKAQVRLPFSWGGISLFAEGATTLRARLRRHPDDDAIEIQLADGIGEPLGTVEALVTRSVSADRFRKQLATRDHEPLVHVDWIERPDVPGPVPAADVAVVGTSDLGPAFTSIAARLDRYDDLAAMVHALDRGSAPPVLAVVPCFGDVRQERASHSAQSGGRPSARPDGARPGGRPPVPPDGDQPGGRPPVPPDGARPGGRPSARPDIAAAAHAASARGLALLQAWLADDRLASCRLVLLTRRAIATRPDEAVRDLSHAPLWGLVRSAQAEYRDRAICLIDTDHSDASRRALAAAILSAQAQVALRDGHQLVPKLNWVRAPDTLEVPDSTAWRLEIPVKGALESLTLATHPEAAAPLADGQVRVEVRAAGLNFRDVPDALGADPGDAGSLGAEGAGVVIETGPGVARLAVGDRVMGLFPAAFGPVAIADQRLLVRMPAGWSFAAAAGVSVAFVTAYYCLADLAHIERGERVLVHAAAGGVGMAAIQLARHLGAEVFVTASPGKWEVLRRLGFDTAHLASSRTLDFEQHFLGSTGGHGVDVVLNSLAAEFADASLRLLSDGGRLIEMGKTSIRDPAQVAADHPGVAYRAFDLGAAAANRSGQILAELAVLFERHALHPLPTAPADIRLAPRAFRVLARAQHVGKLVLTVPRHLNHDGTVLITGGTGTLGILLARHLVREHGVRHLLLASRQGPAAVGAHALRQELEAAGAHVVIAACDVSDRSAVEALLAAIPSAHPLTAVVHAAGVLDDGVLTALTAERLASVLRAKADAAWYLHELTQAQDLTAFILFSSVAGVLGSPGQANYAAASAFLDALAHHRRARGLPALALDWGLWVQETGLTAHLDNAARGRMARGGVRAITTEQGLALFDAALRLPHSALIAARFDLLAPGGATQARHPMLGGLTRVRASRRAASAAGTATLKQRLLSLSPYDAEPAVLEVVQAEAALVLGHASPRAIDANQSLESLGLDSLMAVELRNRLARVADIAFPMQSIRERSTVADLTRTILEKMLIQMTAPGIGASEVLAESGSQVYQQEIL